MARLHNLARMHVATLGSVALIDLGNAVTGFLTFALAGVTDGTTISYAINDPRGGGSEVGSGVYHSLGPSFTRTTVEKSSDGTNRIGLSVDAEIMITPSAADLNLLYDVTAFGRTLIDDAAASEARATLELAVATTDNGVPRFNGTAGATQTSGVFIDDSNNMTGVESLGLNDSNDSHQLKLIAGSNITADRTLTILTGDASRTLDLTGGGTPVAVSTRTILKALDTTVTTSAVLTESGREGVFIWRSGSYSSEITADTLEGVYLKADAIAASAGSWVRVHNKGIYDVKWFGALGDNSTNDYAAIQGCIDFTAALLGGTVLFTKGGYVVNTGLVVSTALVRLQGVGCRYVSILSSVVNINLVTLNAARCAVTDLSLFNQVQGTSDSAVLTLGGNAVQCTASDLDIVGGYQGIRCSSGSSDNVIENVVARQTYGAAIVYCQGAGTPFFRRCIFNNDWPGAVPSSANDKGARANTTAYALNDFVTLGSFIIQCLTAGTSAGSPPSLTSKVYGQAITDGSVTWYIANNNTASAVLVDTGCLYATFQECDFTGAFVQGALVKNGLAGTRPDLTRFLNCTTAGMTLYGFLIQGADGVDIIGSDIRAPAANSSSTAGIYFDGNYVGDANIVGNRINSTFDYGVRLGYSTSFGSAIVKGNMIFGLTKGVLVDAGVNDFQIVDNNLGTSSIWGSNTTAIDVASGASDRYVIMGNRVNGATTGISDAGTGVNKTVQRSAQSAAFSAHKNGSDQTGIVDSTPTKLTFGTEVYDRGGYFASSTWTPPAGPVSMSAATLLSGTWVVGSLIAIIIYKNGAPLKQANWYAPLANGGSAFIQCDDVASGTDTYEAWINVDTTVATTATASGTAANTYFCGHTVTI